jgi:transposase
VVRHRLSDDQWACIEDLFPQRAKTGRPPNQARDMMDGILWILRAGSPWRDLPEELGKWSTVWDYFDRWNADGTLAAVLQRLIAAHVDVGAIDQELWFVDGTVVRAARCAAGGGKQDDPEEPEDHALGRSRGGFSTKIHLVCDRNGHPLHVHLTPGQAHESTCLKDLLENTEVTDYDGQALPLPKKIGGDKGYRADWIDEWLLEQGIEPVIPSKVNEDREARAVAFDKEAYRARNIIERLIGWLKECRRVLTRFEKTAKNYLGMIRMACIQRYLRLITD